MRFSASFAIISAIAHRGRPKLVGKAMPRSLWSIISGVLPPRNGSATQTADGGLLKKGIHESVGHMPVSATRCDKVLLTRRETYWRCECVRRCVPHHIPGRCPSCCRPSQRGCGSQGLIIPGAIFHRARPKHSPDTGACPFDKSGYTGTRFCARCRTGFFPLLSSGDHAAHTVIKTQLVHANFLSGNDCCHSHFQGL